MVNILVVKDPKGKPTVAADVAVQNPAKCPIKFAGRSRLSIITTYKTIRPNAGILRHGRALTRLCETDVDWLLLSVFLRFSTVVR